MNPDLCRTGKRRTAPVIHQHQAKDVFLRVLEVHGVAQCSRFSNDARNLEFVIQLPRRPIHNLIVTGSSKLPAWSPNGCSRQDNRGRAACVADGESQETRRETADVVNGLAAVEEVLLGAGKISEVTYGNRKVKRG